MLLFHARCRGLGILPAVKRCFWFGHKRGFLFLCCASGVREGERDGAVSFFDGRGGGASLPVLHHNLHDEFREESRGPRAQANCTPTMVHSGAAVVAFRECGGV